MKRILLIFPVLLLVAIHVIAGAGDGYEGVYHYAAKTEDSSKYKHHEGMLNLTASDFSISYTTIEKTGNTVYDTTFGTWIIDDAILRRVHAPEIMPYLKETTTHGIRFTFSNRLVFYGVLVHDAQKNAWWLYMQLTNNFFQRIDEQSTNFFAKSDIK